MDDLNSKNLFWNLVKVFIIDFMNPGS